MKRYMLILIMLLMLAGCAAPKENKDMPAQYRMIGMEEAVSMLQTEKDYILLDVRTPEEFAEKHIPGAINIPNEDISDSEPEALPNKNQLILVYCRSGNRSKQASQKLADMGYTNVVEFGGINDWPGETVSGTE